MQQCIPRKLFDTVTPDFGDMKCTVFMSALWQEVPATVVHFEKFEDLSESAFKVTIARVQQLALKNAGGPVPVPSKQLALINQKKGKEQRSQPILYLVDFSFVR